jgi:DNA-binding HxlR family transcriptional regulator
LNAGEGIATNVLADKLSMLERSGIISKEAHPSSRARILYRIFPMELH